MNEDAIEEFLKSQTTFKGEYTPVTQLNQYERKLLLDEIKNGEHLSRIHVPSMRKEEGRGPLTAHLGMGAFPAVARGMLSEKLRPSAQHKHLFYGESVGPRKEKMIDALIDPQVLARAKDPIAIHLHPMRNTLIAAALPSYTTNKHIGRVVINERFSSKKKMDELAAEFNQDNQKYNVTGADFINHEMAHAGIRQSPLRHQILATDIWNLRNKRFGMIGEEARADAQGAKKPLYHLGNQYVRQGDWEHYAEIWNKIRLPHQGPRREFYRDAEGRFTSEDKAVHKSYGAHMNDAQITKFLNSKTIKTKTSAALENLHITPEQARTAGALGPVGSSTGAVVGTTIGAGIGFAAKHPGTGAGIGAGVGAAAGGGVGSAAGLYAGRPRKPKVKSPETTSKSYDMPTPEPKTRKRAAQVGLGVAAVGDAAGGKAAWDSSRNAVKVGTGLRSSLKYAGKKSAFPLVVTGLAASGLAGHELSDNEKEKNAMPKRPVIKSADEVFAKARIAKFEPETKKGMKVGAGIGAGLGAAVGTAQGHSPVTAGLGAAGGAVDGTIIGGVAGAIRAGGRKKAQRPKSVTAEDSLAKARKLSNSAYAQGIWPKPKAPPTGLGRVAALSGGKKVALAAGAATAAGAGVAAMAKPKKLQSEMD